MRRLGNVESVGDQRLYIRRACLLGGGYPGVYNYYFYVSNTHHSVLACITMGPLIGGLSWLLAQTRSPLWLPEQGTDNYI